MFTLLLLFQTLELHALIFLLFLFKLNDLDKYPVVCYCQILLCEHIWDQREENIDTIWLQRVFGSQCENSCCLSLALFNFVHINRGKGLTFVQTNQGSAIQVSLFTRFHFSHFLLDTRGLRHGFVQFNQYAVGKRCKGATVIGIKWNFHVSHF